MIKINIEYGNNVKKLQENIFTTLNNKKRQLEKEGKTIYNLSVGTPDMPPSEHVMKVLAKAAQNPENYKYALNDTEELLEAVKGYYKKRFYVDLEQDEIMSISGTQEGLTHIWFTLCNSGDTVLVPNPGYSIFHTGPMLNGLNLSYYYLREENGFLPDFSEIPELIARKAKVMIVSYPNNPTCVSGTPGIYRELIKFAKKYNIIILHDNAYPDILFDGRRGSSFLAFPGAKDVGIEFYSLSKSFNLTGARIAFAVGNKEIIQKFKEIRSQIDYGMFLPIQKAAVAALNGPWDQVNIIREEYEKRRNALCKGLNQIGWETSDSQGTMFVWTKIPEDYRNAEEFAMELLDKTGIICVPGSSFGTMGENYVRFALVIDVETIETVVQIIEKSGMIKK
jgi:Aspartate/tyrosine/aromatic aminotransferase